MAKVLLVCQDLIGPCMAGPAIRYWEMAHALSRSHELLLLTSHACSLKSDHFAIKKLSKSTLLQEMRGAKALISQEIGNWMVLLAKIYGTKLILDVYAPSPIEGLEIFKEAPISQQKRHLDSCMAATQWGIRSSDLLLCANSRQKNLWLGLSLALQKVHPVHYQENPNLTSLIEIVPFGLSSKAPQKTGPGLREKFHLSKEAKVLLWGGGIWNWFDPLTLIRAVHILSKKRADVHLVFMGIKHPNPLISSMQMCQKALQLAHELDLMHKSVHFNFGWIPYAERQNFLLDADIGVSTHLNHLETQLSFRTRILDYLWAALPLITTEGDCFADLVERHQLGLVVPFENSLALAQAIETILDHPEKRLEMQRNIKKIQPQYYWERVVEPIQAYIEKIGQSRLTTARHILKTQGVLPLLRAIQRKVRP